MAQRYAGSVAQTRMANGRCPECGEHSSNHVEDVRMWVPRVCSLLPSGVLDRIEQFERDRGVQVKPPVV